MPRAGDARDRLRDAGAGSDTASRPGCSCPHRPPLRTRLPPPLTRRRRCRPIRFLPPRARRSNRSRRRPRISGCGSARDSTFPRSKAPNVAKWEEWYAARPDYVARMIDRSRRYLYYIVVEVEKRDMPLEIALLPMVESAFNPQAVSVSRASGIWQFMPSTGSLYGMKQTFWMDSRRDVVAATDGALNYLQKLHDQFDDWQLALAAYNWGEGNVARAIAKNQKAGRPTDYASLAMPDETRNYLPKLQAVKNIVSDPDRFGFDLGDIPDAPYFAVVKTSKQDGRQAGGGARRNVGRRIHVPQSAPQPAGDRRGRRIHDPAPDRQGGALRRQARSLRPAARVLARVPVAPRRDAAAGRREVRHAGRVAAGGERDRPARQGAGGAYAARSRRASDGGRCGCADAARCSRPCRRAARSITG